jgi:peptidoglycan hydrolase CwlO-like protein
MYVVELNSRQKMEALKSMLANNQETLVRMDASMKANQKNADANQAKAEADMKTMQEKLDASHKEAEAMRNEMKTNQAELKSAIAQIEWKKPASVEMKPEVAHEEVPLEDAAVMPVEEPRKRRRDQNLDPRRRRKQQERTQKRMDAERIRSQPTEGRPIVRNWHDAGLY